MSDGSTFVEDPKWSGRVPTATYDAVRYVLYNEGMNADGEWLLSRLANMSKAQIDALLAWIDERNESFKKDRSGHPVGSPVRDLVTRFQR